MGGVMLITSVFAAMTASASATPAAEPLVCPEPLLDLGRISAGLPQRLCFTLANRGSRPIHITAVQAGCGCVRRHLSKQELSPGQQAQLQVELFTLAAGEGPQRWTFRVLYRVDGANPNTSPPTSPTEQVLELEARAVVQRLIHVEPARVIISTYTTTRHTIRLADRHGRPLRVLEVSSGLTGLKVSVTQPEGDQAIVTIEAVAELSAGYHETSIHIKIANRDIPQIDVPVVIHKRKNRAVVVTPEEVELDIGGTGAAAAVVQIRGNGSSVRVVACLSDHPAVQVRYPQQAAAVSAVRISLAGSAPPEGEAVVRVQLDKPIDEEIVIPVRWRRR